MSEVQRIDNVAGAIVYWSFGGGTSLYNLRDVLEKNGFGRYSPERMTDGAALRAALAHEFEGHKVFPIDIEGKTVFEVVKVHADKDRLKNDYEHVLTASVTSKQVIELDNYDPELLDRLTDSFRGFVSLVPVSQLTAVMVDIVMSLGGVTMRPAGGIYWVPDAHWERWKKLADDVELTGPKNRVDACRVILDESCLKAVREALSNEVSKEAQAIDETIHCPKTGMKAAESARKRAQALQDKIKAYEQAFSIVLPDLAEQLNKAVTAEATAVILDAAQQMTMFATAG